MHASSPLPEVRVDLDELLSGYTNSGFAIGNLRAIAYGRDSAMQKAHVPDRAVGFVFFADLLTRSLAVELFLQFVDGAVQVLVGAALLVDLADGVHHRGVVLVAKLAADFG